MSVLCFLEMKYKTWGETIIVSVLEYKVIYMELLVGYILWSKKEIWDFDIIYDVGW